mgnify:CR=1 FL=1
MKQVEVYTDGACSGNPGPGGWGAVLRYRFDGKVYEKELSGGEKHTTNNRMELTGVIEALTALKYPETVLVKYLIIQSVFIMLMRELLLL